MDSQGAHNLVGETETYTDMQNTKRHEFEQTVGDNEGQGSLACCSSRSLKELDMT